MSPYETPKAPPLSDFAALEIPTMSALALAALLMLVLSGVPHTARAAEAPAAVDVERLLLTIAAGDADEIYEAIHAGATPELWDSRGDAGWRTLASRMADWGGIELQELDANGDQWTASGQTGDGESVRFHLRLAAGRLAEMTVRRGGPPVSSRLPALDLPPSASRNDLARALDAFFDRLEDVSGTAFSGTVLIAHRGEAVYRHATGLASRRWNVPNRVDTRFDLGSINKLFTKAVIGQMVQEGRLELDDPLIRHLPDYPNPEVAARITLGQLVGHGSGLGDIFNSRYGETPKNLLRTPRDFFPLFADEPLLFEPGTGRSYSNAGYQVLGAVIEAVDARPYHDAIRARIFEPAGMASTDFFAADEPVPNVAMGYTRTEGGAIRNNLYVLPVIGSPAGSSFSTLDDLLRFDRALREYRLLDPAHSEWVLGGPAPSGKSDTGRQDPPAELPPPSTAGIGVAGGAPGVSAVVESDGILTVIALANFDELGAAEVALHLRRSLADFFDAD